MKKPAILVNKTLELSQVKLVIESKSNRKIKPEFEEEADKKWEAILKDAKETGKLAYDNPHIQRLNDLEIKEDTLVLHFAEEKFSKLRGLREISEIHALDDAYWPKGLYICSLTCTSDNKYIFGKVSGKTLSNKKYDYIGGVLDEEVVDKDNYLRKMILQEFEQEVNINESNIEGIKFVGLIISGSTTIGVVVYTKLNINSEEVLKLHKEKNDEEMESIEVIEEDGLEEFLKESFEFPKSDGYDFLQNLTN